MRVLARVGGDAGGRVRRSAAVAAAAECAGVPSPAVTPTNLLYNVTATPGALLRFRQENRLGTRLTGLLVAGTLPGVVTGAVLRVEVLSSTRASMLIAAGVLLPL